MRGPATPGVLAAGAECDGGRDPAPPSPDRLLWMRVSPWGQERGGQTSSINSQPIVFSASGV